MSANRAIGAIVGVAYLVLGMVGFAVSGAGGFVAADGGYLFGVFEVNGLQNVVHLVLGATLALAAFSNAHAARRVNSVIGGLCLVWGIVGLFIAGTRADILALNTPDQVLHFASAVVLLGVGLGAPADHSVTT